MTSARLGRLFAVGLGSVVHGSAFACAVCGGGKAPNEGAYYDMTIFMSLFPLGLIGAVVGAVYYFKLEDKAELRRDGSPEAVGDSPSAAPPESAV